MPEMGLKRARPDSARRASGEEVAERVPGEAQPVQISPSEYAPGAGRADDTEQCLGAEGAGYAFSVKGPAGDSLIFLRSSL